MKFKVSPAQVLKKVTTRLITLGKEHTTLPLLLLIVFVLCYRNYVPGAYLSGWDTLHPEFNYRIYWSRMLGGVWQEHQSLGGVATQAHAAEIPRVIILMILDIFLRTDQIRIFYAFLMIILGPTGVYFFIKNALLKNSHSRSREVGAFAGALLYLLNLGTLQHFYVPLEMFLTHFGFLGWIFYTVARYLDSPRVLDKRNLRWFALITFLTSSQAHTSTLFYAFMLGFLAFLGMKSFIGVFKGIILSYKSPDTKIHNSLNLKNGIAWLQTKKSVVLVLITLIINLYWFLPNVYFALNHGEEIQQSKIHQLFSQEAFLQNTEFGNINDAAILRNFLFNWGEHTGNAQFGDLMEEWKLYHENPYITELGYVFFGFIILGLVAGLLKRNTYAFATLGVFAVAMFFWFNINPPLGSVFIYFQEHVPLFKEAFRFPFTKFSILLIFAYAVFFGMFFGALGDIVYRLKQPVLVSGLQIITISLITLSLITYMLPAFYNSFISPSMKVEIPNRYFELFDYLDAQQAYGRVANLPIQSFWGWVYHDWDEKTNLGYQGAGFLWFGIKQPLLDREFDRWNLINENYYQEMSNAVYSEDPEAFERVLEKYKVRWVLVDKSVLVISADPTVLFYDALDKLIENSGDISIDKDFGDGLVLYKYTPKGFYTLVDKEDTFVYAGDSLFKEYEDPIYRSYPVYINDFTDNNGRFPFVGITKEYEDLDLDSNLNSDESFMYLSSKGLLNNAVIDKFDFTSQYDVYLKNNSNILEITLENLINAIPDQTISLDLTAVLSDATDEYVLTINEEPFVLNLDVSHNEPIFLGTININSVEPIVVSMYRSTQLNISAIEFDPVLETCSHLGDTSTYSMRKYSDGFGIYSKQVNACVTDQLKRLYPEGTAIESFIGVKFDYISEGAEPDICLLDSETGLCVNPPRSKTNIYTFIDSSNIDKYFLRFFADGSDSDVEVGVRYSNVLVDFPEKVLSREILLDLVSSPSAGILDSDLKFKKDPNYSGPVTNMPNVPRLCNGDANYKNSSIEKENGYLRYISHAESLCDSFIFDRLSHSTGYLLEIKSRHVKGIPLRICLTNEYSKRCDIYITLHDTNNFKTQYFMIPPIGKGLGYTLNISNLTFGNSTNINDLEYIGIAPIPYSALRSSHEPLTNNKENENLVVYYQSYEKGWVALCGVLPCKAKHVMVNNWANGWIFNGGVNLNKVHILFWPQILENIGLVILIILSGWLFKSTKDK